VKAYDDMDALKLGTNVLVYAHGRIEGEF